MYLTFVLNQTFDINTKNIFLKEMVANGSSEKNNHKYPDF
jgi:hypothetical protein